MSMGAAHELGARSVNRRDFLSFKSDRGKKKLDLSRDRLYRGCGDEETMQRMVQNLDRVLKDIDTLRGMDANGPSDEAFEREFEALLARFRARGGRVEFSEAFAQRSLPT